MKKKNAIYLTIGILVVIFTLLQKAHSDNTSAYSSQILSDSLTNPFTFADLSEPYEYKYREPGCGTISSRRSLWLSAEETDAIVDKVFRDEGIELQKDFLYEKDSAKVVLDGFDPKSNIGYIRTKPCKIQYYDAALLFRASTIDITSTVFNNQLKYIRRNKDGLAFKYLKKHNKKLSVSLEGKEKLYDALLLIRACENKIRRHEKKNVLAEILYDIVNIEDEKERKRQYNNLGIFLTVNNDELRETKQKILANQDKAILSNEIQAFGINFIDPMLSINEARYLENSHKIEGGFIAIIDTKDKRFSYPSAFIDGKTYREIKEEKGNQGIRKAQKEEENRKKEAHEKALKDFETYVRQYIKWAKQQGAY